MNDLFIGLALFLILLLSLCGIGIHSIAVDNIKQIEILEQRITVIENRR